MSVIVYVRVSTEEQADSGLSIEAQTSKARMYCELHELDVAEVIVDAGESAKNLKRPGLRRALDSLNSGEATGIVITKLDRLTRSVGDWQTLIDGYFGEKAGKALHSVQDSIDTTTAAGRLVLNVLLSVAQWEREAIAERTSDALQAKKKRGERVSASQYGFDLDDDGKTLVANDSEQDILSWMRTENENGKSFNAIARSLNAREIPTKRGGKWHARTVAYMIRNAA